jgi:hypothetical protein
MWQHSCSMRIQIQAVAVSRWWWICVMPWLLPFQEVTACMIQWYEQWRCLITETSFLLSLSLSHAHMHTHTHTHTQMCVHVCLCQQVSPVKLLNSFWYWEFKSIRQISFVSALHHLYSTWSTNLTLLDPKLLVVQNLIHYTECRPFKN